MAGTKPRESESLDPGLRAPGESAQEKTGEIRRFLLRIAKKKGIRVKEYKSQEPCDLWFCRLESLDNYSTAVSYSSADAALIMAFFAYLDPSFSFLNE